MKVLFLTKYSQMGASSRLRSYQYFPLLKQNGINAVAKPLFNSEYISSLLEEKKSILKIVIAYLKRLMVLLSIWRYEYVVIEKEVFPYLPAFVEYLMFLFGVKYTVIYDDAIFHNYDLSNSRLIRFFLKEKIDKVMRYSKCTVVGNSYLKDRATKAGAKNIKVIPTVVDTSSYQIKKNEPTKKFIIGWIGSPSTFFYLKEIESVLKKMVEKYNWVHIHIIGTSERLEISTNVNYIKWSEETEVQEIQKFDVGIMPLKNSPWELGKCAYKLIQYMGCGKAVIASPIGMNSEVVNHKKNGFLAKNNFEWIQYLEEMIEGRVDLQEMGAIGRSLVEKDYSLEGSFGSYKEAILNSITK